MEATTLRTMAVTALAPIAWGLTYYVTRHFLPADLPLTGAAIRALPAGLLVLALRPGLLRGHWWWRTAIVSMLTVGGFFVLVYIAGQRLPSSVAAVLMATSALAMLLLSWAILGQRPALRALAGALLGILGVALLVGAAANGLDGWGVLASGTAMLSSCLGFVLTAKWQPPMPATLFVGWQLVLAGVVLTVLALTVEGVPRTLPWSAWAAFGYLSLVGTALANVCWFHGLSRLAPGQVGLIGLLNPVSGAILGVAWAGEWFTLGQLLGMTLILLGVALGLRARGRYRGTTLADEGTRAHHRRCSGVEDDRDRPAARSTRPPADLRG